MDSDKVNIRLIETINYGICQNKVFKLKLNNVRSIEDGSFRNIVDHVMKIIKMNVPTNCECRIFIEQNENASIVLPSMEYHELNGTLFYNLILEELDHAHSMNLEHEFRVCVIYKNRDI